MSFADKNELREAVKIFTGTDDFAKQQLIYNYGEISEWDVRNVTNMHGMFYNCINFNADIGKWDVG